MPDLVRGVYRVLRPDEPAVCVTGGATPGSGGISVADPRPWENAGHYGVMRWGDTAPCITGSASVENGRSSVADPTPSDVPVIISEDGCWHRPLTILEMAALQGFDVSGLTLDGSNRAKWQERIGNAIPPPTAEAIGGVMLLRAPYYQHEGVTIYNGDCLGSSSRVAR